MNYKITNIEYGIGPWGTESSTAWWATPSRTRSSRTSIR